MTDPECQECVKPIGWDEYVVNWTSCSDCFDKGHEEYLSENPQPPIHADDFNCLK